MTENYYSGHAMIRSLHICLLSFLLFPVVAQETGTIRIGLLVQDKTSLAAQQGAELAVKRANEKGGIRGRPVELLVRSMEGPWGTGSKQAVDLIFEENVWALLGSHDGRNAHLVEQAATKSIVVFMSAWPSDPTLSQAYVPWFFNCVPNDDQQAEALIGEIYSRRKLSRVATIVDDTYDSNQALRSFLKKLNLAGKNDSRQFLFSNYATRPDGLTAEIRKTGTECLILFCRSSVSLQIIRLIRREKPDLPVFGSQLILNENELSEKELREFDNILLISSGTWPASGILAFRQEYQKAYGRMPGLVATYAFDGMNLLIDAARNAGSPDREKLQNYLANHIFEGVSGTFSFDDLGSRVEKRNVMPVQNGFPVANGID